MLYHVSLETLSLTLTFSSQEETGFPSSCASSDIRAISLADYLTRTAVGFIRSRHINASGESSDSGWHGPKGGVFNINSPGQQILPRTSAMVVDRLKGRQQFLYLTFQAQIDVSHLRAFIAGSQERPYYDLHLPFSTLEVLP